MEPVAAHGSTRPGPGSGRTPESFRRYARLGFLLSALLVLLLAAMAFWAFQRATASGGAALIQARDAVGVGRFQSAITRKMIALRQYLAGGGEASLNGMVRARREALAELDRIERHATPSEKALLGKIRRAEEEHQRAASEVAAVKRRGGDDAAVQRAFIDAVEPRRDALVGAMADFFESRAKGLEREEIAQRSGSEASFWLLAAVALGSLGVSLAVSGRLMRRFTELFELEREGRLAAEASAAAVAASEGKFRRLYDSGMIGICFTDLSGSIQDANDAFLDLVGHSREELSSEELRWDRLTPAGHRDGDELAARELSENGVFRPYEKELVRPNGRRISVLLGGAMLADPPDRSVAFLLDVSAAKLAEAERARLLQREQDARGAAEAAQRRFAFLARASEVLASSLDHQTTLQSVARLAVSEIADWCLVDVVPGGAFRRLAVAYADPANAPLAKRLEREGLLDPEASIGPPQVLRSGVSELLPRVTDEMLRTIALTPEAHDVLRGMSIRSVMTVAIRDPEGIAGIITLVAAESGREFGAEDLKLAEDLAVRATVAMENARLFDLVRQERAVAEWHERRSTFLARASEILASSLDYRGTLASVARLAVPEVADWCFVDMIRPDGGLSNLAVQHSDPAMADLARQLERRFPYESDQPFGPPHVVRTGDPELATQITDEMLRAFSRGDEHLRLLKEIGIRSYMCVPLEVRGRTLGTVTLASAESDRRYEPDDLALGEALAYRASLAIDNARLYGEAQGAIRVRDEFLSVASHELKTPVTTLQLQIQSLLRRLGAEPELPEDELAMRLTGAERQVDRLTQLINELLDISRITGGRLDLQIEDVDLAAVVREVAGRLEQSIEDAGCTLALRNLEPQRGQWDRLRLDQIVTNLLSNAMKYGAGKPIEIVLGGTPSTVQLEVRDRGIGIDSEDQARIFERFERAVSGRHYGGLGLGLWIVRQIVEASGGTIAVRSAPGEGSVFFLQLPRSRRATGAAPVVPTAAAPEPPRERVTGDR
ncbi:MAG: ATP-binding protein [Acidobacteriota bacterium]